MHTCELVFITAGWVCLAAQIWVVFFASRVQGSAIYIIPPLPTIDYPCFRFQNTDLFCDPVVANWTSSGVIQQHMPDLDDASQFNHCIAPGDRGVVQFAFGCINDLYLESLYTVLPVSQDELVCAPPTLVTDNTNCETQVLQFKLGNAETNWWVATGSTLVDQTATRASLLHPLHTSLVLRVNYSREPTEHDSIQLLPQDGSCAAVAIMFTTLRSLQRHQCGILNPDRNSPSDLSWDDINASWIGVAYFVLITGFYVGTYFDAWRDRIMLSQVYQVGIMQAQLPVILQLTWSTVLFVNVVALLVPFIVACVHFIYTFRIVGERRIGFPSKTTTESWKTLVVISILSVIIWIFTQVVITYN